jgi:hypothetical protein
MNANALVGMVRCASCNNEMERGRFASSSPIVVDVCVRHGVWLDAGELGEVVDFVAKRARGEAPPEPVGPGGHTFRHGPRVIVVRAPAPPPPSRTAWIVKSVVVGLVMAVAVRFGIYWYAKKQGAADINREVESSGAAAGEANKAFGH